MSSARLTIIATICLAFCGVLPVYAEDQEEVAQGSWINLFDKETLFGWTVFGDGRWRVEGGNILCDNGTNGWLATNSAFQDFELELKFRGEGNGTAGITCRAPFEGNPYENDAPVITLAPTLLDGKWHTVTLRALGENMEGKIDDTAIAEELTSREPLGHIGILYHHSHRDKGYVRLEVSDVRLRPLRLRSLFNGKDLTGWNIIPGHKSEFKVVDGALNIKNGNGQIETADVFKNFLLQIDIISNGDKLNSGVFFRTPPDVFWKGLESQIRNQWEGDDRTKPVDFGTGGLYGVQEARKVVSSDREWFTKTIVVNGNHFAVWVNGYLVSDFFDTRPPALDADGKNGYVKEAGTINLQGHDPTTDLSFKNIWIQQYPD